MALCSTIGDECQEEELPVVVQQRMQFEARSQSRIAPLSPDTLMITYCSTALARRIVSPAGTEKNRE